MVTAALPLKVDYNRRAHVCTWSRCLFSFGMLMAFAAFSKQMAENPRQAVNVTVMTVSLPDTPVDFESTALTESSRKVEIRASVAGFQDKRAYTEGQPVHVGQTLFLIDPKPFEAVLQSAKGQIAQQQARLAAAKGGWVTDAERMTAKTYDGTTAVANPPAATSDTMGAAP